eukprot:CAMPEP_0202730538 /NCGR_PEP_ID=MMETSP1385-20130828/186684_1 /ASSEMBLY_ACC=CAM_ASM_000861 /TAXON_ID=933848 /ORGANISM="Elphidium margaritaceum" /LENGTH=1417 /DNA_ID=CAMNT_0049396813 /DNA_START=102 /DNA_END=4355 /DNA_ORIENTATION=-
MKSSSKSKFSVPTENETDWDNAGNVRTAINNEANSSNANNTSGDDQQQNGARPLTAGRRKKKKKMNPHEFHSIEKVLEKYPVTGAKHKKVGFNLSVKNGPKFSSMVVAAQRGVIKFRHIPEFENDVNPLRWDEKLLTQTKNKDRQRVTVMERYFHKHMSRWKEVYETTRRDLEGKPAWKRVMEYHEHNLDGGGDDVFKSSKLFYQMLEHDVATFYIHYRRIQTKGFECADFDHVMFDAKVQETLLNLDGCKFIHLLCKPWQCWSNQLDIDESSAKVISNMALVVAEHYNMFGRFRRLLPEWLIMLRRWEHAIARQYLTDAVYSLQVQDQQRTGEYWARYHPYVREENDEVFWAKWRDGTDHFPSPKNMIPWYDVDSTETEWLSLEEYENRKKSGKRLKRGDTGVSRQSTDTDLMSIPPQTSLDMDADAAAEAGAGDGDDDDTFELDLGFLDGVSVSSVTDDEHYTSSESDDDIAVQKYHYRCPEPIQGITSFNQSRSQVAAGEATAEMTLETGGEASTVMDKTPKFKEFAGWTPFHESFVNFMNRDLLDIDASERGMVRSKQADHWRRRHLHLGNGYDLPIAQYRLITKKLNLEHEVRENLRMIATLKEHQITASAPLTQTHYMPDWIKFKALKLFNDLKPKIVAQQQAFTAKKKQLLRTYREQIEIRQTYNARLQSTIDRNQRHLQSYLHRLQMLNDRQIALLDYIVTAKHRVAAAKLKVEIARQQVEILENDVKDLREMTPREQQFAQRNKHYLEAVSVEKLCKQYRALKHKSYDENRVYLARYREKIKLLLKNVALYNLCFWNLKERYNNHSKWEVIARAYALYNPKELCELNLSDYNDKISEMLLSGEHFKRLQQYNPYEMRQCKMWSKLVNELTSSNVNNNNSEAAAADSKANLMIENANTLGAILQEKDESESTDDEHAPHKLQHSTTRNDEEEEEDDEDEASSASEEEDHDVIRGMDGAMHVRKSSHMSGISVDGAIGVDREQFEREKIRDQDFIKEMCEKYDINEQLFLQCLNTKKRAVNAYIYSAMGHDDMMQRALRERKLNELTQVLRSLEQVNQKEQEVAGPSRRVSEVGLSGLSGFDRLHDDDMDPTALLHDDMTPMTQFTHQDVADRAQEMADDELAGRQRTFRIADDDDSGSSSDNEDDGDEMDLPLPDDGRDDEEEEEDAMDADELPDMQEMQQQQDTQYVTDTDYESTDMDTDADIDDSLLNMHDARHRRLETTASEFGANGRAQRQDEEDDDEDDDDEEDDSYEESDENEPFERDNYSGTMQTLDVGGGDDQVTPAPDRDLDHDLMLPTHLDKEFEDLLRDEDESGESEEEDFEPHLRQMSMSVVQQTGNNRNNVQRPSLSVAAGQPNMNESRPSVSVAPPPMLADKRTSLSQRGPALLDSDYDSDDSYPSGTEDELDDD